MNKLALIAVLVLGLVPAINCRGDAATPIKWRAYWIPLRDTYATWNWTKVEAPAIIQWANLEKLPTDFKNWEFAACSTTNLAKTAREPLATCVADNIWVLDRWLPGNFPVARLAALGDGTFLCAILADGKRISNVSRIKINRAYRPDLKTGIQIFPVPFPDDNISTAAIRIIPGSDWDLHQFDMYFPYFCVDGVWSTTTECDLQGVNFPLRPGEIYGEIWGFGDSERPVKWRKKAQVQVEILENSLNQRPPSLAPKALEKWLKTEKGYTSPVTELSDNEAEAKQFDAAFGLK